MTENVARARTRSRPAANDESTQSRAGGRTVSEQNVTNHSKVSDVAVVALPEGLIARITVKDSVTLNMGNYNSFRREIGLELDIPLDTHTVLTPTGQITKEADDVISAAYDSAQDWVSDRVTDAIADANQFFKD